MYGQLLFTFQMITIVFCLVPLSLTWPKPLTLLLLVLQALLTLWILAVNRLGNWSVFPQPLERAKLITSGPYGLIRHPMYTVVMLFGLTAVLHNQTLTSVVSFALLVLILRLKAGYEESLLLKQFEHYAGYMSRTSKRFIPWIL